MVNNLSGYVNFGIKTTAVNSAAAKSTQQKTASQAEEQKALYSTENIKAYQTTGIKTNLSNDSVKQKYAKIASMLEPDARVALSGLLKAGVLLNNNSNDGSTVLDNLHKIVTEPRIKGLNSKTLVSEAITAISNPGSITQTFGDIPESVSKAVLKHPELGVRSRQEMDINKYSNCCVAASLEYNLACEKPAEFVRMAAGLSSEDYSVSKNLKLSDIADKREDAIWLLDTFRLPYQIDDKDNVEMSITPDRNAIIRARVQTSYRDSGERSSLDVLMQSAFMNVGAQQTYNSLNDTREGLFTPSNAGLANIEKSVVEEIVMGESKVAAIYMVLAQDGTVQSRFCDYSTMAQQLVDALQTNNVIAGYVDFNESGQVIGGHEITIIGSGESPTGDLVFVCNDTCDGQDEPIYILAENLLPRLHDAGLPKNIAGNNQIPTEFDGIEYYREMLG